ncbi:hypothetical protein [Mesorhizobium huakuii]|uniref:Uncharacterized protein n=1 Tax=Mesorhizobium huakuii TaxID=28104 RepID=A0ABZ0VNS3_9HYPH|nr:hypothetical protein [Mesorhizobium huakuii]WQB97964.1 hypothetical protein U0R22_002104 [Mesorhizobium huakuii]
MSPDVIQLGRTAISRQCSALADAKKLHGKAREKFRADCKKNGGKATRSAADFGCCCQPALPGRLAAVPSSRALNSPDGGAWTAAA